MSQEPYRPSQEAYHPLEAILRMCARAAPQPWYFRHYAKQTGVDPDHLVDLLEVLWLEGLVQKVPGTLETGPGATLTPLGQQVLNEPAMLDRLRRGEAIRRDDPGAVVRSSLRERPRPWLTYALIAVNIVVFLLQSKYGLIGKGSASAVTVQSGEWWRLLTSTFLHGNWPHLAMNMFSLWAVGSLVERTWGRWRFLVIYFVSAWAGSCLAMAYQPPRTPTVGASGAVCGVLGAIAVWIVLYGKYMPRDVARRFRFGLIMTFVIAIGFSLLVENTSLPGVGRMQLSHWGHLGGLLGGAAAALVLHFQRFGRAVALRWAAVLLAAALPAISYAQMTYAWKGKPLVAKNEEKEDEKEKEDEPRKQVKKKVAKKKEKKEDAGALGPFLRDAGDVSDAAEALLESCVKKVPLNIKEARKDAKKSKALLATIAEHRKKLDELQKGIEKARYKDKRADEGRKSALELIEECRRLCDVVTAYLKDPDEDTKAKVQVRFDQVDDLAADFKKQMEKLRKL
jgi:membrane associated rhomboid family serine protease